MDAVPVNGQRSRWQFRGFRGPFRASEPSRRDHL